MQGEQTGDRQAWTRGKLTGSGSKLHDGSASVGTSLSQLQSSRHHASSIQVELVVVIVVVVAMPLD